ncbi:FAD-dependent monooxygenase [Streptomyces sp. NPDC101776]|uniref:FAD-dependent monooxygenase n=1 Tax=Streptomyces sp. NPDC101776 TaxID=3366146 RepID=UPI0037F49B7F
MDHGHELVGFEPDADGVTARIVTPDGEQTVRTRYLIGADGGSSLVRKALDIGFPGRTLGVRAIVADVSVDTESGPDMPTETSADSTGTPRTRREHRQLRTAAEQ